jgi:hypothetical protein
MKKNNIVVCIAGMFILFTINSKLFSQENNSKYDNAKKQEAIQKNTTGNNQPMIKSSVTTTPVNNNVQKQVDTGGKSFQLDENDPYQGRREEFLSQITLKELPSDFPKYEKWMGVRHYNNIITEYYKKHLDIVTPKVKEKLTRAH